MRWQMRTSLNTAQETALDFMICCACMPASVRTMRSLAETETQQYDEYFRGIYTVQIQQTK